MRTEPDSQIVYDLSMAPASVELGEAVVQGVRAGFGILSLAIGVALRTLGESQETVPRQPGLRMPVAEAADLVVGTAWGAAQLTGRVAATGARIAAPAISFALRPPLVPRWLQPAHGAQLMVERWQRDRPETLRTLGRWSSAALPGAVDAALDQVDVEQVAAVVLDRVNLDVLVADILRRLDVTAVTLAVLQGLDLTKIATTAIESTDLDRAVNEALGRLDVDDVAARLLDQLDLTKLVLDRVDLERVVAGALDGLDLTSIVVDQVDLGGVVSAALQHVDLTQIVMQQVDLLGVAEYVIDGVDLPEIIRDSTGSVASEAVVGLRMQGVDADIAVGRIVDRILGRRRQRRSERVLDPMDSEAPPRPPAATPV
ncbi:MAG: hypothetical protein ABI903_18550 [Actinomycetota bacterium]